ncbi:host specificity J domain protein [Escherichia coli P0304816.2]|nr:host specificity J domain protein [Escherichia coli P0304816.2]
MDAFGCTSRGQAHRAGLWLIKTELLETQTVDSAWVRRASPCTGRCH